MAIGKRKIKKNNINKSHELAEAFLGDSRTGFKEKYFNGPG